MIQETGEEPMLNLLGDPGQGTADLLAAARVGATARDATTGGLFVLSYGEIDRLARDRRVAGVGLTWFDVMGVQGRLRRWYGELMFTNEGEAHARLRRLVSRAFTPRSVEQLRAYATALAEGTFAGMEAGGGGDLVAGFDRMGTRVMCRLLGVPEEDVAVFGGWADALSRIFGLMDAAQIEEAEHALGDLLTYVDGLVQRRQSDPADDLITALLRAEQEGDRLDRHEVVTMVANLLVAAHDTTRGQIGCTLLTLLRHPEAVAAIRSGAVTAADAVTETMRMEPSIGVIPRTATEAVEVGGVERPAGTPLILAVAAGNRDPGAWDDPDSFRADRFAGPDTPRPLSFGTGPHYCLGANLARMILEETVEGLARRSVRPAGDLDGVEWRVVLGRSPVALPVTVRPEASLR